MTYDTEVLTKIIRTHRADKVLFGTGFCRVGRKENAAVIGRPPISTGAKAPTVGENARELIGLCAGEHGSASLMSLQNVPYARVTFLERKRLL
jgi:hypothetical protein